MPHLNVELDQEVIAVAKEGAARAGMLLRAWIARAIMDAGTAQRPSPVIKVKEQETRERTYEPAE